VHRVERALVMPTDSFDLILGTILITKYVLRSKRTGMRDRVMILGLDRSPFGPSRLPQAFAEVGLHTSVVCERESLLAKSSFVDHFFPISVGRTWLGWLIPVVRAIQTYSPDMILPADDRAARLLTAMARAPANVPDDVVRVLRHSLGQIEDGELRFNRHSVRKLARDCGIHVTRDQPVGRPADVKEFTDEFGWPVVLKRETSVGGDGVYICRGPADVSEGFKWVSDRTYRSFSPAIIANLVTAAVLSRFRLVGDLTRPSGLAPIYSVETHVAGRPAYCTALAHSGEVVAALSLLPLRVHPSPQGPSCIVTAFEAPALEEATRRIVARLGFTGYCGLDFILEEGTDKPYFLEFNPRATQIVHLGALFGVDLCGALSCVLNGVPVPKAKRLSALSVALFPQDWRRDPSGRDRPADVLDIPMRDPKLFRALSSFLPRGAVVPDLNKPPSFRP
jgi:ATP-grasp domain